VRNGKGAKCNIDRAMRIELNAREKATSGGVYVGAELNWLLPVPEMPLNFIPKPADVLTDHQLDNLPWVIQEVWGQCRDATGYQVWKVRGLALSIAHQLQDLIDVQRADIANDAAGVPVKTFPGSGGGSTPYAQVPARVEEMSREETEERGLIGFKTAYTIYVAKPVATLTLEDRVKWVNGGVTYYLTIKALKNAEKLDELPSIEAVLEA
jgi:hypothetical protein